MSLVDQAGLGQLKRPSASTAASPHFHYDERHLLQLQLGPLRKPREKRPTT